ncbi:hypothetical protein ACIBL5_38760 [Streptomyces sp. NPDC050516]|uniref:hypothetical protein n=1 Tax=Streptomyces sp. NPDC050516 TaxID=3365621 RepID=UPI0037B7E621
MFKNSAVVQYINFWPCGWADESGYTKRSFEFAKKHGVGIGGPDILPYNKPHMNNAYRFLNENRGKLDLVAMAVQEPDFEYDSPVTGKPYTRQEFVELDNSRLALAAMATMVPGPQIAAGPRTPEPAQKSADRPSS